MERDLIRLDKQHMKDEIDTAKRVRAQSCNIKKNIEDAMTLATMKQHDLNNINPDLAADV